MRYVRTLILVGCAALATLWSGVVMAGQADHVSKNKLGRYHKIPDKQVQKMAQDCLPGNFYGPIAPDHDALYLNCEGKILRGKIDSQGYGTLVDDDGNTVTVQPGNSRLTSAGK